jgi:CRP-like cAMP-binding protein
VDDAAADRPRRRHWLYGSTGELEFKAGVADWSAWLGQPAWTATPWGDEDSPVVVTAAESQLERELSTLLMRGATPPAIRSYRPGDVIAAQGAPGAQLYLVLDGIVSVDRDGEALGEFGPGAVLGERAVVEACPRTATLRADTAAPAECVDRSALERLAMGHQRELSTIAADLD